MHWACGEHDRVSPPLELESKAHNRMEITQASYGCEKDTHRSQKYHATHYFAADEDTTAILSCYLTPFTLLELSS
ncbi:MAG: hypothetical protein HYZ71_02685 [Deltaproteobacteria bacterium]|nr:hypothetical protein [Deltaproteobacteria bacterium]